MQNIALRTIGRLALATAVAGTVYATPGAADTQSRRPAAEARDGQHDFDFELGRWKIQLRKLKEPLHGSHEWIEFAGTSVTRPVWNGKAQLEEFKVDSPVVGHIEGMTVRLYSTGSPTRPGSNSRNSFGELSIFAKTARPRVDLGWARWSSG